MSIILPTVIKKGTLLSKSIVPKIIVTSEASIGK
jgi:hypothetical protein